MKAIDVKVESGYKIKLTFDDGVSGVIDLEDFIKNGIFEVLKDKVLFNLVYTTGAAIAWSDDLEIDAVAAYAEILNKKPKDVLSPTLTYAAD